MLSIRVDDFPFTKSEETWRHNLENFKKFDAIFQKHNRPYILGVIPSKATAHELDWMSENHLLSVALHGVNHDERFPNEFRDFQTRGEVSQAIFGSRAYLELFCKKSVDTYIPPHNVFDLKTIHALLDCGFKRILCGPGSTEEMVYVGKTRGLEVIYSPEPLEYGRSDELIQRGSVAWISSESQKRDIMLTLHWTWEWNIGLDSLDTYLGLLGGK